MKIKNIYYRQFIDKGVIELVELEHLNQALSNIKGKHTAEGRAMLICLYYTGGRPVEVLSLRGKDFTRKGAYVVISMPASKRGLARPIYLQYKQTLVKELYKYALSLYPDMLIFHHFRNKYIRTVDTKKGRTQKEEVTDKLRYYFKIWFDGVFKHPIIPYYLRHNRFSKLSIAGLTAEQLRQLKGSKTLDSVFPYSHLSSRVAKQIARKID